MANSERIYLIQGNDTDMSVCLRKGGDTPLPYDLTGASRIGLALTGHGLSFFARDIVVSGEDNNIISGLLAGDLLVGEYGLEVSFTLDGKAKRFRVPQVFEVVSYLSEDQDGTAEGEGDGISITVTVQPEVIEIAGPTGPRGKSAYEVWLAEGHTGTVDDFFDWLAAQTPNPDWNQNDNTAADYVKNRTHYEESATASLEWDTDVVDTSRKLYLNLGENRVTLNPYPGLFGILYWRDVENNWKWQVTVGNILELWEREDGENVRYEQYGGFAFATTPQPFNLGFGWTTVHKLPNKFLDMDTEPTTGSGKPVTSGGVKAAIADFVTRAVNDLLNYYTKTETYTKAEVDQLVAGINNWEIVPVAQLPEASADTMHKIYLVPSSNPKTKNVKDEYITVEVSGDYSWEQIGTTAIDLTNYVTKQELTEALANYVTSTAFTQALATKQDKIDAQHKLDYSLLDNTPEIPDPSDFATEEEVSQLRSKTSILETFDVTEPILSYQIQISTGNVYVGVSAPNGGNFYGLLPGHTYIIVPQPGKSTIIAILQNIDNVASGNTPAFSSQRPGRIVVAAGNSYTFVCPEDGHYLYMILQPGSSTYDVGTITHVGIGQGLSELQADVDDLNRRTSVLESDVDLVITESEFSKSQMSQFEDMGRYFLDATNSIGKTYSQVTKANATAPAHIYKIPLNGKAVIKYPVFLTSSGYGCLVADANDTIIAQYANTTLATGTLKTINTSANAAYFYFSAPSSISSLSDYQLTVKQATDGSIDNLLVAAKICWLPFLSDLSNTVKTSLNLAGIRFEYVANKIPFQRGYLFHKNNSDDRTIFYGTKLDNAQQVGTLDYYPHTCVIGVSSKDGTVIGVGRDTRAAIHVFQNGQNYTVNAKSSDGADASPKGWLYNSGCEFIPDGESEYCIFAEYDGQVSDNQRLYIWKGTYPYTSPSDWKTVYYKTTSFNSGNPTPGSITHWHMIRRDPWTGIIYCTSGDFTGQFFWIYSTDNGETWNELASDSNTATKPSWVLDGQPLRCINFIFTKDYIYFATDHGSNNTLSRIQRATNGLIDLTTREILSALPYGIAVNSLCYIESPNGLFMFTRIDTGFTTEYSKDIPVLFWSFVDEKMYTVARLKQLVANWGGHRGKCYFNYTNGQETRPAMGFAGNTPCGFDLIGADGTAIGTIYYEL